MIYQNRAAANERLEKYEAGLKDCDESIKLNNRYDKQMIDRKAKVYLRYGKSLDRRSKIHKKMALDLPNGDENIGKRIEHLKQSMEDVSMVAQLEGYKHEQLLFVDEVLKHLGSYIFSCILF